MTKSYFTQVQRKLRIHIASSSYVMKLFRISKRSRLLRENWSLLNSLLSKCIFAVTLHCEDSKLSLLAVMIRYHLFWDFNRLALCR